jgi:hypothetical protein
MPISCSCSLAVSNVPDPPLAAIWFCDDVGGSGAFPLAGNAAPRALILGEGCAAGGDAAANWALALADGSCGLVGLAGSVLPGANGDSPYDAIMTSFDLGTQQQRMCSNKLFCCI